jgi:hypothetical protein
MPVQTRSQKKATQASNHVGETCIKKDEETHNNKEEDENQQAALILLKLNKENADLWNSLKADEELEKKKAELVMLKKIKRYTDRHNALKEIISIYTQQSDRLEMKITSLMSSMDR